jgi:hypothetical protein
VTDGALESGETITRFYQFSYVVGPMDQYKSKSGKFGGSDARDIGFAHD